MKQFNRLMTILSLILVTIAALIWLGCAPPVGTPDPIIIDEYTTIYFDNAIYQEICAQATDPDNIKLSDLTKITALDLRNKGVKYLTNISYLPNLENLNISFNPKLKDLNPLIGLKNLKILNISNMLLTKEQLAPLASLESLNELYIMNNYALNSLGSILAKLSNLHTLSLSNDMMFNPYANPSMGTTENSILPASLTKLDISGDTFVPDLNFLADWSDPENPVVYTPNLTEIIASNSSVDNISAVGMMKQLSILDISSCNVLFLNSILSSGIGLNGGKVVLTGNNPVNGRDGAKFPTPEDCVNAYTVQVDTLVNYGPDKIEVTN